MRQLHVHGLALGSVAGSATLVVPGRRRAIPGRSYLAVGIVDAEHDDDLVDLEHHDATVITVDEIRSRSITSRVGFTKCDVEGAESAVLRGASTTLDEDRPLVLCEIEDRHARRYGHTPDDVAEHLRSFRYEQVRLRRRSPDEERNQLWVPVEQLTTLSPRLRRQFAIA